MQDKKKKNSFNLSCLMYQELFAVSDAVLSSRTSRGIKKRIKAHECAWTDLLVFLLKTCLKSCKKKKKTSINCFLALCFSHGTETVWLFSRCSGFLHHLRSVSLSMPRPAALSNAENNLTIIARVSVMTNDDMLLKVNGDCSR